VKARSNALIAVLGITVLILVAGCAAINSPPIASFICSQSSGKSSLTVAFDASSSYDSDGTIVSYQWTFGDGSSGTGITTSHTYTTASNRNYTVMLKVTDNEGAQATATRTISVTGSPLEILGWQLQNDGNMIWPWVVIGHAKNIGGQTLSYAEVRANFYDANGVLLNNWLDNALDLPPGTIWEFNIRCLDSEVSDRVHHATVSVGTCI